LIIGLRLSIRFPPLLKTRVLLQHGWGREWPPLSGPAGMLV